MVSRSACILLMNCVAIPLIILWTAFGMLLFPFGFLFMKFFQGYTICLLTRKCIWIYGRVCPFLLRPFVIFFPPDIYEQALNAPGILVVNHRSFFDTYCMNMMPIWDVCFAVRDWPFNIPFYNIFMKLAGYMNIETFSWDKILKISRNNFKNNSFILFFPEGHRARDKNMTHFYSGAFKLAIENNVPIIPVCLIGTEDLLPPNRYYLKPARIKMDILAPVRPDQFEGEMKHLAFKKHVKMLMENHINQMEEETR